jgi:holo-ACP synthase
MNGADLLSNGQPVTLKMMLQQRDSRAARQRQALDCYRLPLISFSLVTPGAVKNSPYGSVLQSMRGARSRRSVSRWNGSASGKRIRALSGPEWMAAVCAPAKALKRQLVLLEQQHPLGRLWDIDVIDSDGRSLSRRELGLPDNA